jgi:hypothetical protein
VVPAATISLYELYTPLGTTKTILGKQTPG